MVYIPNYERQIRMPTVRVDESSSGDIGRAITQIGQSAKGLADKWKAEKEHDDMTKAKLSLSDWANQEIDRINSLKGYEAEGAAKKFSDEYKRKASEIIGNNESERVRTAFTQWAEAQRQQDWANVAKYERGQQRDAAGATTDLRFQQIQDSVKNGYDPNAAKVEADETAAFAVSSGVLLPAEAQFRANKEREEINKSAFEFRYSQNPSEAIRGIKDSGLSESDQMAWKEKFADDQWQDFTRQNQYEKIMEERREKAVKRQQTALMNEGFTRQSNNQLTVEWYDSNVKSMAPADALYFGRQVGRFSPSAESSNSAVINDLNGLAASGKNEELQATARLQYVNGNISTRDYEQYMSGRMTFDSAIAKEGADHIKTALRVSDMNPDPAAPQRLAEALSQWNQYVRENPNATPDAMRKEYKRITGSFALIDATQSTLVMELPRGIGSRQNVDMTMIDEAEDKLAEDFQGGLISESEMLRQAELFERWRTAIRKKELSKAERGANAEQ